MTRSPPQRGLIEVRGMAMRRNVAEEAQGIGLVAPFPVFAGMRQCLLGGGLCLLQISGQ